MLQLTQLRLRDLLFLSLLFILNKWQLGQRRYAVIGGYANTNLEGNKICKTNNIFSLEKLLERGAASGMGRYHKYFPMITIPITASKNV